MYDELIARIRYHIRKADFMGLKEYESTRLLNEASDAIEGLSHAVDQMTEWRKNRWIPVTERLPEIHTNVLVVDKAHDMAVGSLEKIWDSIVWVCPFSAVDDEDCKITHWMPLPEPPLECRHER